MIPCRLSRFRVISIKRNFDAIIKWRGFPNLVKALCSPYSAGLSLKRIPEISILVIFVLLEWQGSDTKAQTNCLHINKWRRPRPNRPISHYFSPVSGGSSKRPKIIPTISQGQLLSKTMSPKSEQMPQQEKQSVESLDGKVFKKWRGQSDEWTDNITCWAVFHQGTYKKKCLVLLNFPRETQKLSQQHNFF